MEKAATILVDPDNPKSEPRRFVYDYSYWSHDGYKVAENGYFDPATKKYVDQVMCAKYRKKYHMTTLTWKLGWQSHWWD